MRHPLQLVAVAFVGAALCGASASAQSTPEPQPFQMSSTQGNRHFDTHGRGAIVFTDDLSDVASLSDGGYLTIRATTPGRPAADQIVEIRSDRGTLLRTYTVGAAAQQWSDEAQRTLAMNIAWLVRRSGLGAAERTNRILKARGIAGVLSEIQALESDYVRRLYFAALVKAAPLDADAAGRALTTAAGTMRSPHDLAEVFIVLAPTAAREPAVGRAYVKGAAGLSSDYERRRVLTALVSQGRIGGDVLTTVIDGTGAIVSDYDRAELLLSVVTSQRVEGDSRHALLRAVDGMRSPYDRDRVLAALVRSGRH